MTNRKPTMKELIKGFIKRTPLYFPLRNALIKQANRSAFKTWERNGRPAPPPHLEKQRIIESYAKQYDLKALVETGTYYGDMVEAMKNSFERVYSIELSPMLYAYARKRFRRDSHVELFCGDSGQELEKLVPKLDRPALFWLDAHYSAGVTARADKDTPIFEELSHILNSIERRHVIIIDDARCFGTNPAYPSIDELTKFVQLKRPETEIVLTMDSIRITPTL